MYIKYSTRASNEGSRKLRFTITEKAPISRLPTVHGLTPG